MTHDARHLELLVLRLRGDASLQLLERPAPHLKKYWCDCLFTPETNWNSFRIEQTNRFSAQWWFWTNTNKRFIVESYENLGRIFFVCLFVFVFFSQIIFLMAKWTAERNGTATRDTEGGLWWVN